MYENLVTYSTTWLRLFILNNLFVEKSLSTPIASNLTSPDLRALHRMTIIHVSVHMISRMEEYMIPYLMDKSLTRSEFNSDFKSYDC